MKVRLARTALDAILLEAQHSPVIEICGLLTGADGEIGQAVPAENVASDPRRTVEIDPAVLLAAHRRARSAGGLVLGHYHSHPRGRPMPSRREAARRWDAHTSALQSLMRC